MEHLSKGLDLGKGRWRVCVYMGSARWEWWPEGRQVWSEYTECVQDQCRQLERLGHRDNSSRTVDICGGSLREKRNNVEEERLFSWDSISLGTCTFSPPKCRITELICFTDLPYKRGWNDKSSLVKPLKCLQLSFPHTCMVSE